MAFNFEKDAPHKVTAKVYGGTVTSIREQNNYYGGKVPKSPSDPWPLPPDDWLGDVFTGREDFLRDLHNSLKSKADIKSISGRSLVIHGPGGMGKSSVVKRYAKLYRDYHQGNIGWIDSEDESSLRQSFNVIGNHFGVDCRVEKATKNLVSEIYELVSHSHQKGQTQTTGILFIFDNANQLKTDQDDFGIMDFLPNPQLKCPPLILITSRNKEWGLGVKRMEVKFLEKWGPPDSLKFIKKMLTPDDDDEEEKEEEAPESFQELSQNLDGYPLALNLATAHILQDMEMTMNYNVNYHVQQFLVTFHKNVGEWVNLPQRDNVDDGYDKIIATVWKGTTDKIEERGRSNLSYRMATELLKIISYLPTDRIPVTLTVCLYWGHKLTDYEARMGVKTTKNVMEGQRALGILEKYSLIRRERKAEPERVGANNLFWRSDLMGRVIVHRLVQKWTKFVAHQNNDLDPFYKVLQFYSSSCRHRVNHFEAFEWLLDEIEGLQWPPKCVHPYVYLATQNRFIVQERLAKLYQVWSHRERVMVADDDASQHTLVEHINLTKMAIVSNSIDWLNDPVTMETMLDHHEKLLGGSCDNSWCKISVRNFFCWAFRQSLKFKSNGAMEFLVSRLILALPNFDIFENDLELRDLASQWIGHQYSRKHLGSSDHKENVSIYDFPCQHDFVTFALRLDQSLDTLCLILDYSIPTLTPVEDKDTIMDRKELRRFLIMLRNTLMWSSWGNFDQTYRDKANQFHKHFIQIGGLKFLIHAFQTLCHSHKEDWGQFCLIEITEIGDFFMTLAFDEEGRKLLLQSPIFSQALSECLRFSMVMLQSQSFDTSGSARQRGSRCNGLSPALSSALMIFGLFSHKQIGEEDQRMDHHLLQDLSQHSFAIHDAVEKVGCQLHVFQHRFCQSEWTWLEILNRFLTTQSTLNGSPVYWLARRLQKTYEDSTLWHRR